MSGNWLRLGVLTMGGFLAVPTALWAQDQKTTTSTTLDTVVVTATRSEEKLREVTSNVTVLSTEKIKASTANTLDQLMEQQGFQVVNQGAQKILAIRGMRQPSMGNEMQSPVLVLVNGRRIGANNVALMGLDKDNIDRIEIIRGPSAVQFGSSAMGGVVNIITKKGQDGFQGSLEAGLGSYNLNKESLSLSGAANGFDVALGMTQFGRDAYNVEGGDKWHHTDIGSSLSTNLDLGYTFFENHRIGTNVNYYRQNNVEASSGPSSGGWSETGAIGVNDVYGLYDLSNYNWAFTYDGATEDKTFDWAARYSFGKDVNESDPSHSQWGGNPTETDLFNNAFNAQAGYNGQIFSLTLGVDYLKYKLETDNVTTGTSEDTAGYFSGKLRLLDEMLILSAGGRYDSFEVKSDTDSKSKNNFAPTFGVAVLPLDWLKLRTNYAHGFRMPAPNEFLGGGAWYAPNKDLEPEKSKTFEVGADINYDFWDASLTYFHTKWEDKLVAEYAPALYKYQYRNLKKATMAGFEFAAGVDIGQAAGWDFKLRPYVNLTYLNKRENSDPGSMLATRGILPNTPKTTLTYGLDFNHEPSDITANLNAVYFSNILTSDYRTGSPTNSQYIEAGSGTVVNLSLEKGLYEWENNSKLKLRVDVNNVFDASNTPYLDYPGPGRNFYAGLKYEFN